MRRQSHPFRRLSEVQTLDHRALLAARKFDHSAGIRAGDSQRMDHLIFIETQEPAGRHRGAKGSRQSGRVEAAFLKGIASSDADPTHNLAGRHEGGQERFPVCLLRFAHSEGGRNPVAPRGGLRHPKLRTLSNSKAWAIVPLAKAARCDGARRFSPKTVELPERPRSLTNSNYLSAPRLSRTVKSHCNYVEETVLCPRITSGGISR